MKKKLAQYALNIATTDNTGVLEHPYCYLYEGRYFVANRCIIVETEELVPGLEVNAHAETLCKTLINFLREPERTDYKYGDYVANELPPVKEIKDGIYNLVGRTFQRVVWSGGEGWPGINARFLYKAMEALNAKKLFFRDGAYNQPVFFYENDDVSAITKCMILPVHKKNPEQEGFWTYLRS